jgi:O-antigen biosynthesis protein
LACPSPQPVIYSDVLNEDQLEKVSESLKSLLSYLTVKSSIFIINLPFWTDLVIRPEFDKHKIIYDCMDYHAGFNNSSANMEVKESLLIRYADAVIVSSKKLYDRFENTKNLKIIRNAGEFERFAINPSATKLNSSFPNIGYFGAISEWFDVDLVEFLAQKKRNWNFTLIGSYADAKISKLQKLPNIKLLNEIPYEELPLYLHSFDVCIIPFIISPLIEHTNPVKVYEYLSAGKPVVSTMLPELILLDKKLVYLAKTKFDFIKQLDKAMKERNKKALIKFRTEFARKNSWNIRMKQFYKLAIR